MFRATSLGHHGWLFEAAGSRLLVDPILFDRFGFSEETELRAWPPRRIDVASFPSVDAVFLTHEHEGHFEPASLNVLDRDVPVYFSSRSSHAMRRALVEMGFRATPLEPDARVRIGALELLTFATDQNAAKIEEWDVLAYLVRDAGGHGSFFTTVDMVPTAAMREKLAALLPRVGLFAYTANHHQYTFQTSWQPPDVAALRRFTKRVVDHHDELVENWEAPEASLVVGGGWSFGGELAWLNDNAFLYDTAAVRDVLTPLLPDHRVIAPRPGETIAMRDGAIVDVEPRASFVEALASSEAPSRAYVGDVPWLESYRPACGRTELADGELDALSAELTAFAAHLYGGALFKSLFSLGGLEGRMKPTFALSLKDGDGAYVFEYDPLACDFVAVECADPVATYAAVYECWATDLLATLRVEMSQNAIGFGRSREWNAIPDMLAFPLAETLFTYVHPLRFRSRFLELYRKTIARTSRPPRRIGIGSD